MEKEKCGHNKEFFIVATIDFTYYDGEDIYNDGSIEDELLRYYRNGDCVDLGRDDGMFLATSVVRNNIVNWYPFEKGKKILELGAGLGSVTEALLKTGNRVISVESSKRRSEVIYERFKEYDNLEIYCGNFNNMEFREKFDYIVLIGVFEYAKLFVGGRDPFRTFFKNITTQLAPGGKVLIAIENKLGLKYFNGLSEDHYGVPYVGIEDYCDVDKMKTFGKKELSDLFLEFGFKSRFYGVFPDYKAPQYIFSENYHPSVNDYQKFTQYNYHNDLVNFDIQKTVRAVIKNGLALELSNSFFIEICEDANFNEVDFATYYNFRNDRFLVGTVMGGGKVVKFPVGKKSEEHLETLMRTHAKLNQMGVHACKITKKDGKYFNEWIDGKTILAIIREYVEKNDYGSVLRELKDFQKYIDTISVENESGPILTDKITQIYGAAFKALPCALLDVHADNVIKKNNSEYVLIDQEWVADGAVPAVTAMVRTVRFMFECIPEMRRHYNIEEYYRMLGIRDDEVELTREIDDICFNQRMKWLDQKRAQRLREKGTGVRASEALQNVKAETKEVMGRVSSLAERVQYDYKMLEFYKSELGRVLGEYERYKIAKESENDALRRELNYYNGALIRLAKRWQNKLARITLARRVVWGIAKAFKKIVHRILKIGKRMIMALLYHLPSKTMSRRIYYKIHRSPGLARRLHEFRFDEMPARSCIENGVERTLINNPYSDKKIAVHLHLYYTDLADEFYEYLSHIPYGFDLYISVIDGGDVARIRRKFKKLFFVNNVVVEKTENSGRDFGPMFVLFGDRLKKYDYLLHVHSKKSLRTGAEQINWRRYLLDNLLGSNEMVMQYFDLMENNSVGLAYPDTTPEISLWCHTWLRAAAKANEYFGRFGLYVKDEYLNFSVGSMFWCRVDAIRQLFDLNLKWEDFGAETGADDGTLAHAIERGIGATAIFNNYKYASLNRCDGKFYINRSLKNLSEYIGRSKNDDRNIMHWFNAVTFDIFDTLITRVVYEPDDVFKIVDTKVRKEHGFSEGKFIKSRKQAEEELRAEVGYRGDVDINEIYERFAQNVKITKEEAEAIKELEIETDIKTMIPRRDMLDIYNDLLLEGKKIILITDMYYTKEIIERILRECGYDNWYDLLVSSDVGCRKSDGTMWQYYWQKYPTLNSVHVGDNESSDVHYLIVNNKPVIHVLQGRKLYELSDARINERRDMDERIVHGLIVNKCLANSPFALNNDLKIKLESLKSYGYTVMGPLMFYYLRWLIHNTERKTTLLFVSREGYFLRRMFHDMLSLSNKTFDFDDKYFLISRRAISVPNIETENDIKTILETQYHGTFHELIMTRFGLILPSRANFFVSLPNDLEKVMDLLRPEFQRIFEKAKQERSNYERYIDSIGGLKNEKVCVVDLGYSGTAQYYISKMLKRRIDGAYMLVTDNLKPLSINHNKVKACLNKTIYADDFVQHGVGRHAMLLEAFLTSNQGQLQCFDEKGEPVFANTGDNNIENLEKIYDGVKEFMNDVVKYCEKDIMDIDLGQEFVEANYERIICNAEFSDDIKSTFKVEDLYASNGDIQVS